MAGPRKTKPVVSAERVLMSVQSRFNPIRNLTPALMATQIENFDAGYLSSAALTWQKMEDRDDTLKSVAPKRKKAASRHGYEIIALDDKDPRAAKHKETLEYFYDNLTATSAIDLNYRGGVSLLIRYIMDAVGKKYSAIEMVWEPGMDGLTATFLHVPLWFFEHTTARLRYLATEGAIKGEDLPEGEWLVAAGDGLMIACSVAYMFKHLPLKDWLIYSERHGMPGLHGETDAKEGSTEWNTLVTALQNFGVDWSMVTNRGVDINKLDMSAMGELPYPKLIERMDRTMAALWRGADLSTMSAGSGEGTGASLQGEEADILEHDDATWVSEILNEQVDRWVIRYALGDDRALAYIKINTGVRQDVKQDLEVDGFFLEHNVPTSRSALYHRYGRPEPEDDEDVVSGSPSGGSPGSPSPGSPAPSPANARRLANAEANSKAARELRARATDVQAALTVAAVDQVAQAQAKDLQPVRERLETIMQIEDPALRDAALKKLKADLPGMLLDINKTPAAVTALENTMGAALVNGYAEAATVHREAAA